MRIGIDLGGMSAKLGLVNEKNEIVGKLVIPTRLDVPAREMIHDMAEAVKKLAREYGLQTEELEGIGIGSPGTVDQKTGSILYSNNFSWEWISSNMQCRLWPSIRARCASVPSCSDSFI